MIFFFLYETHVIEDKQKMFQMYFKNYCLHWIAATKTHNFGRASGGCLYGFKRDLQKRYDFKFTNIFSRTISSCKLFDSIYYLIPVYLNCTNWKNDFEKFEEFMHVSSNGSECWLQIYKLKY